MSRLDKSINFIFFMMARCYICGKGPITGAKISHSHRITNRWFKPNLQKIRIVENGKVKRRWICTKCIKSGKVVKPAK